ncbi:LOW QUALITY PROTEIN: DDE_4 domain-containing protein, partial [Cephalotus follicularis]
KMLCMHKATFLHFWDVLKREGGLENTNNLVVEEQVAMFLIIIGKTWDQRAICDRFQHTLETVNRHFRRVMRALASLAKHIKCPSVDDDMSPHIKNNRKYFPWFKDCVGAIDKTYVSAWEPVKKTVCFRGRKSIVTQNVMCTCNFNMEFTFVYYGWKGTANDSRVFRCMTRLDANFPWPSPSKYFLVDVGFFCTSGFIPPYQDERYHLQKYKGRGRTPTSIKGLFNYMHSSFR